MDEKLKERFGSLDGDLKLKIESLGLDTLKDSVGVWVPVILFCAGLAFTFYGRTLSKLIFFVAGFSAGFGLCVLMSDGMSPDFQKIPLKTQYVIASALGMFGGFFTLRVVWLAMFCLGVFLATVFSGLLCQLIGILAPYAIGLFEFDLTNDDNMLVYFIANPPENIKRLYIKVLPLLVGFVFSRRSITNFLIAFVSASIGGYFVLWSVNDFHKLYAGEPYSRLWEYRVLTGQKPAVAHPDDNFWILINVYIALVTVGTCFQQRKKKQKRG